MDRSFKNDETGTIKSYLPLKGFGFIQREKGKDVFFLRTDSQNENWLHEGAIVSFSLTEEAKGPRAHNIKRIG